MHDEELFDLIRSTLLKYCNEGEPLTDENGYVICTGGEVIEDENGKRVLHNPTICRKPPSASQVANGIKLLQMQPRQHFHPQNRLRAHSRRPQTRVISRSRFSVTWSPSLTSRRTSLADFEVDDLKSDFVRFCLVVWRIMGWDYAKSRSGDRKVAPIGLVEEDIMNYIADESNRDIGVLAFRGIGKTHIVIAYAAWCLWNDPEMKIVIISKSQGEAKKSLNMLRSLFQDIDFLHHLMPQKGQHDSAEKLQVGPAKSSRQPSVTALGVSGQIPGNRSHLIIADDIEDKENTKTLESRDNLYERTHEFMALGYPGVSRVIVIGTYHNDDSLYMRMAKSGYKFRTWPAEYLDDSDPEIEIEGYAPMLRRHIHEGKVRVGDATCPHRFSKEELKRQRSKGRSHYYRQFLLISNVADALRYPLKLSDFIVHHVDMDMGAHVDHVGRA